MVALYAILYHFQRITHFNIYVLIIAENSGSGSHKTLTFLTEHCLQYLHNCFIFCRILLNPLVYSSLVNRICQQPVILLSLAKVRQHHAVHAVLLVGYYAVVGGASHDCHLPLQERSSSINPQIIRILRLHESVL